MKKGASRGTVLTKGKRGQFYLISAIIISSLIVGIAAVSNYIQRESTEKIHDLREEIKIESEFVMDYSLKEEHSYNLFYNLLSGFTENYIEQYKNTNDIYFLFGSENNMTLKGYQNEDRKISLSAGETTIVVTDSKGHFIGSINPDANGDVKVYLDELEYSFAIKTDRNFYFILTEKIGGSEYIVTG